jgi:hypothetical protein
MPMDSGMNTATPWSSCAARLLGPDKHSSDWMQATLAHDEQIAAISDS